MNTDRVCIRSEAFGVSAAKCGCLKCTESLSPPAAQLPAQVAGPNKLQELIARWRKFADQVDDGSGVTSCAIAALVHREHADEVEEAMNAAAPEHSIDRTLEQECHELVELNYAQGKDYLSRSIAQFIRYREEKIRQEPPAAVTSTQIERACRDWLLAPMPGTHDAIDLLPSLVAFVTASLAKAREEALEEAAQIIELSPTWRAHSDRPSLCYCETCVYVRGNATEIRARALRLTAPGRETK